MAVEATYRVVAGGGVLNGFEESEVVGSFAKLFSTTTEKASSFLQPETLINKNLTKSRADDYKTKLEALGLPVAVVLETPTVQEGLRPEQQREQQREQPTEQQTKQHAFTCPKCQLAQEKDVECIGCRIIFEKYTNRKNTSEALESSRTIVEDDHSENTLPATAFIAPLIAAAVGALAWKAIALSFSYELGLLAWAIGGAVGAAAAIAGARGEVMGGYCAAIALLAIFAGKYMTFSSYQQEIVTMFNDAGGSTFMTELYEEAQYDAEVFATVDKSDASVKQYMVDHAFSDAGDSIFVSDQELEDFRLEIQPWLESDTPEQMYSDGFDDEPDLASALTSTSPGSLVFESLDFIDLLFAFLGLSTAFQIGRSGYGNTG